MVSRALWDDVDFRDGEMTQREALLWMLAEASWKTRRKRVGSTVLDLRRGQLAHSTRFLAKRFEWSEARVRRYLKMLENRRIIDAATDAGITVITFCNYDKYQASTNQSDAPPDAEATQERRTSDANENKGEIKEATQRPRAHAREAALAVAGPGLADPAKEPGLIQTSPEIDRWLQAGCDLEADILPVIQAKTSQPRGSPIRSWKFFTDAVIDARDRRLASLPAPDTQRFKNERTSRGNRSGSDSRSIFERRRDARAANG